MPCTKVSLFIAWVVVTCGVMELAEADAGGAPSHYLACMSCHGLDGWGSPATRVPAIAGQSSSYVKKQLLDYRSGVRGNQKGDKWGAQMALMAQPLSDDDVAQLAYHLAEQPLWPGAIPNAKPAPKAALPCLGCHSKDRAGWVTSTAPILWGLSSDYLFRQLVAYRQGDRGGAPPGEAPDPMAGVVDSFLSDQVLMDIARYFANE